MYPSGSERFKELSGILQKMESSGGRGGMWRDLGRSFVAVAPASSSCSPNAQAFVDTHVEEDPEFGVLQFSEDETKMILGRRMKDEVREETIGKRVRVRKGEFDEPVLDEILKNFEFLVVWRYYPWGAATWMPGWVG